MMAWDEMVLLDPWVHQVLRVAKFKDHLVVKENGEKQENQVYQDCVALKVFRVCALMIATWLRQRLHKTSAPINRLKGQCISSR